MQGRYSPLLTLPITQKQRSLCMSLKQAFDIHEDITNKIIDLLERVDLADYKPPFASFSKSGLPINPTTDHHYQGVNILNLWCIQHKRNFHSNEWATFKQWKEQGAAVKKGEKGSRIIFYKTLLKEEQNKQGEMEAQKIPMLKLYSVFNATQVEGYDTIRPELPETDQVERIALIDEFCANTKAEIRHDEPEAYFVSKEDYINMPDTRLFTDENGDSATENYYATLLHEMTHWTGAKSRLNREGITDRSKEALIVKEELIAELGSAFLCAQLGIEQTQPKNHALYIKSWLTALKNDKTMIFKAAAQAAKAQSFLNELNTVPGVAQ